MQARKYFWQIRLVTFISFITLFTSSNVLAAKTPFQAHENGGAESRVISTFYNQNGQKKLIAGFEIKLKSGWRIYAPDNSGSTSFSVPPSFDFSGSDNIDINKINPIFPPSITAQEQIGEEIIKYSVYQDAVIIPIELEMLNLDQNSKLEVEVNYGLCKEICFPVSQKFSLEINPKDNDPEILENIQKFLPKNTLINKEPTLASPKPNNIKDQTSLYRALFLAFIGGFFLNIMPCVLPVLSIKLLGILAHGNSSSKVSRLAFFSTTLGIIFAFMVFATTTIIIKSIGNSVGWGFQFQNPYFLLFLLVILMTFIANLLGMFEFNFTRSVGSILNNQFNRSKFSNSNQKDIAPNTTNIFISNFMSGILAVLLATPCSAPFVGVAISFALSSEIREICLIFLTMSLGLSLPYILLIIFPAAIKILPKPGQWMAKTKQLMASFLIATTVWILYILMDNIGFVPAMVAAMLSILILLFFKVINKINFNKQTKGKLNYQIITAVILFITLISSIFIIPSHLGDLNKINTKKVNEQWINFDESKIDQLLKEGKVVVVDITANWCISCKANKAFVLESKEFKELLLDKNIITMRGDLTKPNKIIFDFMKKYNRYGIPFNIVFGPSSPKGILVSELLSKEAIIKAINKARIIPQSPS